MAGECGSDGMQVMLRIRPVRAYASAKVRLPRQNQLHSRAHSSESKRAPVRQCGDQERFQLVIRARGNQGCNESTS